MTGLACRERSSGAGAPVPTELFAGADGAVGGGSDMARRITTTPLRRPGTTDEIGSVVAVLPSDGGAGRMTAPI